MNNSVKKEEKSALDVNVSWKKIFDTEVTNDSIPGVVAVGNGGILYPFEHCADSKEVKFKSGCAYLDGALFIGDWKMFITSETSNTIETTMPFNVIDCTSIKVDGTQHTYVVTSEGHVLYSSSASQEPCSFKTYTNVADKFSGCMSGMLHDKPVVIFYGSAVLVGTPGSSINTFKRYSTTHDTNISSVDILPNGHIITFDSYSQMLNELIIDKDGVLIGDTTSFISSIINVIAGLTNIPFKFNNIHVYDNNLYLLGDSGFVAMMQLDSNGNIDCEKYSTSTYNSDYVINGFYITKIMDTDWNDMIKINGHFIGVGSGKLSKSMFDINNLYDFIISHDIRHSVLNYANEIMRLISKKDIKFTMRHNVTMSIDEDRHPYFNLNDFIDIEDTSDVSESDMQNIDITIIPISCAVQGKQDWRYEIVKIHGANNRPQYNVRFPYLKCGFLRARVTIKI